MNGTTILQYKIGPKLGSGGMGEVYRAEDTRLGRAVALKFLGEDARADTEKRQRLFQEARAASALRSPHVAAVHDVIEHERGIFIVMELVDGESLASRLERGPPRITEVVDIALQVARALEESHSLGIIHRDIKPANLMVTPRGLVKVLDFGIAKQLNTTSSSIGAKDRTRTAMELTSPGVVLGTVSYMSPEQAFGRPLDHRTDLFSLGVVLYQMVTGTLPFVGATFTQTIDRILHHEPTPPAVLNAEVPAELSLLIQRLLQKDLQYRVQSAEDLAARLLRLQRAFEPTQHGSDRNALPVAASSWAPLPGEANPGAVIENAVAVLTFSNLLREPADDWIGTGIAETVTADLQGLRGVNIIGRSRVHEILKALGSAASADAGEAFAMDIGRRLGATWIVRGAYQRLGELVRITAQFSEVATGRLLTTVKVDGKIQDIFQLQDRIVYGLTQGLSLNLEPLEIARIEKKETQSVEAYECFSRATLNLRSGERDALDRAVVLFEKALALDSRYAAAWAGLASAQALKGSFLGIPELIEKAVDHARRALEINPQLSSAHQWLGSALSGLGRYEEAIVSIANAIRLEPTNAAAHAALARAYWMGQGDVAAGVAELEKCIELNPDSGYAYLQLAFLHAIERDLARGEAAGKKAVEYQEKLISGSEGLRIVGGHSRLGYIYYLRGDPTAAIREYELELDFLSTSDHALRERTLIEIHFKLGAAWLRQGNLEESRRHLDRALKSYETRLAQGNDEPFTQYYAACAYALRGDVQPALLALARSIARVGPLNRLRARTDPDLETLRDNASFAALLTTPSTTRTKSTTTSEGLSFAPFPARD